MGEDEDLEIESPQKHVRRYRDAIILTMNDHEINILA